MYKCSLFQLSHTTLLNKGMVTQILWKRERLRFGLHWEEKSFLNTEHQSYCFCRTLKVQNGKYYNSTGLKNYFNTALCYSNRFFVGELIGAGGGGSSLWISFPHRFPLPPVEIRILSKEISREINVLLIWKICSH